MKLFVGLGNPGSRYSETRHNIGFVIIDQLAAQLKIEFNKKQCQALTGQGLMENVKVLLVKPQTYMNNSGNSLLEVLNFYKERIDDFIIIHDDLDMDFGRVRFKESGGSGGHNGLKSISRMLNSSEYARLKIGIGRPPLDMKVEDYVLKGFLPEERKVLSDIVNISVKGLFVWGTQGIHKAMNEFNGLDIS